MKHQPLIYRDKGQSLLDIPNSYTIIDLETTGLSTYFDNIIEVGLLKIRDGKEIDRYQSLVKPSKPIPYTIECITGISNDMVASAPTFEKIGQEVWEFLENEIIIGHNVNFDINFLYDNFERSLNKPFQNNFVDTLRLAHLLIPDIQSKGYKSYSLDDLCCYFGVKVSNRHRSIGDCLCTYEVLNCLKKILIENNINLNEQTKEKSSYREIFRNLQCEQRFVDTSHVFFGKCCVFTGKLEEFTRVEAAQIVVNIGGHCEDSVTKRTNFLIVGDMDYKAGLEGYESNKLKKARQLIEKHQNLQILPESAFYDLVSDYLLDE